MQITACMWVCEPGILPQPEVHSLQGLKAHLTGDGHTQGQRRSDPGTGSRRDSELGCQSNDKPEGGEETSQRTYPHDNNL